MSENDFLNLKNGQIVRHVRTKREYVTSCTVAKTTDAELETIRNSATGGIVYRETVGWFRILKNGKPTGPSRAYGPADVEL